MGLLDGNFFRDGLGGVMGALYGAATFYAITKAADGEGGWVTSASPHSVKAQQNMLSEEARAAAGYTELESQIFILAKGFDLEPNTDDKIALRGTVYAIKRAQLDPGRAYWDCRCERTDLTESEIGQSS
jgi:hypothetical protein